MIFIPLINILNIYIILMTMIVFFNYSSAGKPTPTLFQLAVRDDTSYLVYSERKLRPGEKKLTIHEFYLSRYNLDAKGIPLPTDDSLKDHDKKISQYCTKIPKKNNNQFEQNDDFNVYNKPDHKTNNYCSVTFVRLTVTLFECLENKEEIELDNANDIQTRIGCVPKVLTNLLKKPLKNEDESDAAKTKCCNINIRRIFQNKDAKYAGDVITKIGKIFKNDTDLGAVKETTFYMCMMNFKNGVTELNKAIGKYTPERMSRRVYFELDKKYKKVYDRKIIKLNDYDHLSPEKKKTYKMSQANKEKILEIDEINFLQSLGDENYAINTINDYQKVFTGDYKAPENDLDQTIEIETFCITGIKIIDELNFKVTKLSYMIYPNKWENSVDKYKAKKNTIIKNLKLLDTNNNHIYKIYEEENFKMNELSFKRLKLCRAIPGEVYDTYVLRLNNNDCIPLHKQMWESEIIDMKDINITKLSEFAEIKVDL